jgi:hypothetical protein
LKSAFLQSSKNRNSPPAPIFNLAYIFATLVLGAQASLNMSGGAEINTTSVFGTVTGPAGRTLSAMRSSTVFEATDLHPTRTLMCDGMPPRRRPP